MILLPALAILPALFQTSDPAATVKAIRAAEIAGMRSSRAEKAAIEAVEAKVKADARIAIRSIIPEKVPEEQAGDWAELFRMAGDEAGAARLEERAFGYHARMAESAQNGLLHRYLEQGDKAKILRTLGFAVADGYSTLARRGSFVANAIHRKYGDQDPKFALLAYDAVLKRLQAERPLSSPERRWDLLALAEVGGGRARLLSSMGRRPEALSYLRKLATQCAADAEAASVLEVSARRVELMGRRAPEIVAQRAIGQYKGLAALRGKVVLIDFFTYDCGPCKEEFVPLRAMVAAHGAKGLAVVGLTKFMGHYDQHQNLSPDAEVSLMRNRFVPQHSLPWPVVFAPEKTVWKAYGVSGIPHLVIIDRTGKVRRIAEGYTPEEFAGTRAFVERLLKEK